jgi:hypothetical protein
MFQLLWVIFREDNLNMYDLLRFVQIDVREWVETYWRLILKL